MTKGYSKTMDNISPEALQIAELIRSGFVSDARELAYGRTSWTKGETREIIDAGISLYQYGVTNGADVALSILSWTSPQVCAKFE